MALLTIILRFSLELTDLSVLLLDKVNIARKNFSSSYLPIQVKPNTYILMELVLTGKH